MFQGFKVPEFQGFKVPEFQGLISICDLKEVNA